jgi:hypothetical protein
MTIAFPRSLPAEFKVSGDFSFKLQPMLEITPLRSGRQIAAELGPSLWHGKWQSVPLPADKYGAVRAWYDTLLSEQTLLGYDTLRQYPLAYAGGWGSLTYSGAPFDGTCRLTAVADNAVEVTLDHLPAGFTLSPGDYVGWSYLSGTSHALHRISAAGTASAGGTLTIEVRHPMRPGWSANATVQLYRPTAEMLILPDTWDEQSQLPGVISFSFEAIQTL